MSHRVSTTSSAGRRSKQRSARPPPGLLEELFSQPASENLTAREAKTTLMNDVPHEKFHSELNFDDTV